MVVQVYMVAVQHHLARLRVELYMDQDHRAVM
jgi:hypothetical protein